LITEYLFYQYGITQVNFSVIVNFHNYNKQHLILAKFYVNNAPYISRQIAKFHLNLQMQTIVTVAFVRLPQNTLVSGLCI